MPLEESVRYIDRFLDEHRLADFVAQEQDASAPGPGKDGSGEKAEAEGTVSPSHAAGDTPEAL